MKLFKLFLASGLLITVPAWAQYDIGASDTVPYQMPSNDPQAPVHLPRYHGNLKDFNSMQTLCRSDASGDYISTSLCTLFDNEARSGAHDARIKLLTTAGVEDDKTFTLLVHIYSAGTAPRAIAVRVEAIRNYDGAIDKGADHDSAAAFPRQGKMVFYEETITGVGSGDTLEEALRHRLRGVLRGFFAGFRD